MNIVLYGNGGCGNHGCEAIVRGTAALLRPLGASLRIHSGAVAEDQTYDLDALCQLRDATGPVARDLSFLRAYVRLKLRRDYGPMDALPYLSPIRDSAAAARLALSVGGDNYCYGNTGFYAQLNRAYQKNGYKTVLWGCSVEPEAVRGNTARDLAGYHCIVARESITFEALRAVNPNTILAPDPAFFMDPQPCALAAGFQNRAVIGVNVSPMIVSNEQIPGITMENYRELIRSILAQTDASVALIPHVVWPTNDDRSVLSMLWEEFGADPRLILVSDHRASELKYIISQCDFFVGARTHATIAAYSTGVPTLVVGYSVKARGIARDLFGTEEGYVLPVQALSRPADLTQAFFTLYQQRAQLRSHLRTTLPVYLAEGQRAVEAIAKLI